MKFTRWLNAAIDPALRSRVWRLLDWPARRRFAAHLARIEGAPRRGEVAINYGERIDDAADGIVHGGRVKLRHLADEFPAVWPDFNVLYLVSSAPPRHALELVKWAKARGVKLAWNQNGVAYPGWFGARSEEINGPMRALRAQADFIFYQSEFCRACADRFLGLTKTSAEVAYNCVDTSHFVPGAVPSADVCQLLATGSHHESYRVISVLETLQELRRRKFPVALHLAGRLMWPGAEAEVAAKIRALGLEKHVRRTAAFRQEDAPAIYHAAHILLHPKYKDPCPTVPIEAMACGVPVIGSASGGMPELVSRGAGILLEVPESWETNHWPSAPAMADAVEKIMARWSEFHAAARAQATAHFSKEIWLAKHRRVFCEFIAS